MFNEFNGEVDNDQPAFPTIVDISTESNWSTDGGMSLRDYFAAAVLTGIYANQENMFNRHYMNAKEAYEMADGMLHMKKQMGN